ncbi:MAG: hypothetical protein WA842_10125 [Croceibacterium sp.]
MAGFKTGVAVGVLATAVGASFLIAKLEEQPLIMGSKSIYNGSGYAFVEGSIIGYDADSRHNPMNNMISLRCDRALMECDVSSVNQLSSGQISSIDTETIRVTKWTDVEIVATSLELSGSFNGCFYYEIRAFFKTEEVTYLRIPNPRRDVKRCKELFAADGKVSTWRIGQSTEYRP